MMTADPKEILRVLDAADRGEVPIEIVEPWSYCGTPEYRVGGWHICVFDDAGGWDYQEWVRDPDGVTHSFEEMYEAGDDWRAVALWRAGNLDAWSYGERGTTKTSDDMVSEVADGGFSEAFRIVLDVPEGYLAEVVILFSASDFERPYLARHVESGAEGYGDTAAHALADLWRNGGKVK